MGTLRLLPRVRTSLQMTVLHPRNLPRDQRQKGSIGNSICLPLPHPSKILNCLPPKSEELQDHISYVIVRGDNSRPHSFSEMSAPRGEYEAAIKCLQERSLAYKRLELNEEEMNKLSSSDVNAPQLLACSVETEQTSALAETLLQRGPADAQNVNEDDRDVQSSDREGADAHAAPAPDASGEIAEEPMPCSAALIGGSEYADKRFTWFKLGMQLTELQESTNRSPGYRNEAEQTLYDRVQNAMPGEAVDVSEADSSLQGTEASRQRRVVNKIKSIQEAAKTMGEQNVARQLEANMFNQAPQRLSIPTGETLSNTFEPLTWAMAFPEIYPWSDGMPFLLREQRMSFQECISYSLLREELEYTMPDEAAYNAPQQSRCAQSDIFLPYAYDINRRMDLIRAGKAYVQRPRFQQCCQRIAEAKSADVLCAIAQLGEDADVRKLLKSSEVSANLREAVKGLLLSTGNVIGTEGHRGLIRHKSIAASKHYGHSSLFITPNLADNRAGLFLQLHAGPEGVSTKGSHVVRCEVMAEKPDSYFSFRSVLPF